MFSYNGQDTEDHAKLNVSSDQYEDFLRILLTISTTDDYEILVMR